MKKQGKKIIGIMLALVLTLTCVPVTNAKATTIAEMATQTIKFNEFDTITFNTDVPVVVKIKLKTKGVFALQFKPKDAGYIHVEMYDEQCNLLAQGTVDTEFSNIHPNNIGYNGDLDAGVYYLRMYTSSTYTTGTFSFQTQMYPAANADIQICPTIKAGKTLQLSPAFISCKDKKVTWKSSNSKVATVSASGKVKALKKGSTTIKVYNQSGIVTKLKIKVV